MPTNDVCRLDPESDASSVPTLLVVGVGGHGKVVADAWLSTRPGASLWGFDDAACHHGQRWFASFPCLGSVSDVTKHAQRAPMHLAIGRNDLRYRFASELLAEGCHWISVMHRQAAVSPYARVSEGCFVAALAVVAPGAHIGSGTIVNHGAVVDHDVTTGDCCHIAPGAVLGGGVRLGARVLIGAGATVLPGIRICDDALIGAGAVVVRDVTTSRVWRGVPAREH